MNAPTNAKQLLTEGGAPEPSPKAAALAAKDVATLNRLSYSELAAGWKNIPTDLAELRGWLLWRWVMKPKADKPTKVPVYAKTLQNRSGAQGTEADRENLCTLAEAIDVLRRVKKTEFAGVGIALQADWNITALDFDHVIEGEKVAPWVTDLVDVNVTYGETSPSGTGVRAFYRGLMPPALRDKKHKEGDTGFETFCTKGFVTVTGKELGLFSVMGNPLPELPESVVAFAEQQFQSSRTDSGAPVFDPEWPPDWSKDRHADVDLEGLRWLLSQLGEDYFDHYVPWRDTGFCVHHQFHGREEEADAYDAYDDWSGQSLKYVPEHVEKIWEDAKAERTGGIKTIGTLKHWVGLDKWYAYKAERKAAAAVAVVQDQGFESRIATADLQTLEGQLVSEIRAMDLTAGVRAQLAAAVRDRFKALRAPVPMAEVRRMLNPPRAAMEQAEEVPDIDDGLSMAPAWAREWAWIRGEEKFIHRRTKQLISKTAFDTEMQKHVGDLLFATGDDMVELKASERMFKHWGAKVAQKLWYQPAAGELTEFGGFSYYNMYRPELRVQAAAAWTEPGRTMARAIERHLSLLFPNRRERALMRAWLAHQYLHPGVKVRWAPLLKGCPGDGKSMLGELLELVLGPDNVRLMSADTVQNSDFSGWVEGQCVTVFEEVKFQGHNRFDVVNRLKPFISNNRVEKHGKGKDPGNVANVTNYLMLTNHEDAIPIEEGDRRYFVVFSPFNTLADLERLLQADYLMSATEHFDEIFELVRASPDQLALWFSETEFPAEWDPNMAAPMTEAKESMVGNSVSEGEAVIDGILEDVAEGGRRYGIGAEVVCLDCLKTEARKEIGDRRSLADRVICARLTKAGYRPLPGGEGGKARKIRWREKLRSVWSRDGADISNARVRELLDATVGAFAD